MKLPQISGRELIKKLAKFGFVVVRQKGSHIRLEKNTQEKIIKINKKWSHAELNCGHIHVKDTFYR